MKDTPRTREIQLTLVPYWAKQVREVPARWAWTEPSVWTERMLTALERGVKGGVWFSLIDKVISPKNLQAAWQKVKRNGGAAGVDRQSVEKFEANAERILRDLHEELAAGRFRPQPVKRRWIPKPGTQKMRPLGIPTVKDRIVQGALRHVLEPLWEARFVEYSYGFRPGRSCKDALRRVDHLLKTGYTWVVDADIQSYFDVIPRDQLMAEVRKVVADGRVLDLLQLFLQQSVMDGMKEWKPEAGTPQGAVISPLLANIYLHPVDLAMQEAGFEMTRYADDLVIMCKTEADAQRALSLLKELMTARGLTLHPEKTRLVDATQPGGFDFLGYHFERGQRRPRKKSFMGLKERIRAKTPRNAGRSLNAIIEDLNPMLKGWFEYFKHSTRDALNDVDRFVRRRLRGILRKQQGIRGCAKPNGIDQKRWPNDFFRALELFCLVDARDRLCQSR